MAVGSKPAPWGLGNCPGTACAPGCSFANQKTLSFRALWNTRPGNRISASGRPRSSPGTARAPGGLFANRTTIGFQVIWNSEALIRKSAHGRASKRSWHRLAYWTLGWQIKIDCFGQCLTSRFRSSATTSQRVPRLSNGSASASRPADGSVR